MDAYQLILGDCLEELREMPDNSIDSLVTDPPYGWRFMGKAWDTPDISKQTKIIEEDEWRVASDGRRRKKRQMFDTKDQAAGSYDQTLTGNQAFQEFSKAWAIEAYRVLKPGAHILVFCGPRTYHRMASGVEDAGFEIRDQMQWLFGSGFPKSFNIGKATQDPKWDGWGTALKPANEPILLARKPLSEKTVAANVLKHGCGGINIDASRIATGPEGLTKGGCTKVGGMFGSGNEVTNPQGHTQGRFPANLVLSHSVDCGDGVNWGCTPGCAVAELDRQSLEGGMHGAGKARRKIVESHYNATSFDMSNARQMNRVGDSGGASRFFYCAKASKRERNEGCEGEIKEKQGARPNSKDMSGKFPDHDHRPTGGNNHPTVKPKKLMSYLITMITPPGGTCLDPFAGSGSTGVAAIESGFKFIGIERESEYMEICKARVEHAANAGDGTNK